MSAYCTKRTYQNDAEQCLLSGAMRTWPKNGVRSAYDLNRSLARIEIPQRARLHRNVSRAILRSEKHGRHQQ